MAHTPLFVLVPGHSAFLAFGVMFLLVLGDMSFGGRRALPGVGSAS